jgi:hypothetical protein
MNAAKLTDKINTGYGKAADRIGKETCIYRPLSAFDLMMAMVGDILASFTQNMEYSKFNKYGNSIWTGIFNANLTEHGDYLVSEDGTWFIAAQQTHLPILMVQCNRKVDVLRVTQSDSYGALEYSGNTPAATTPLMQGWPASVLQGTKGDKNPAGLPGDERIPWWVILLPVFSDIILKNGDVIKDDLGNTYIVSSPELTDLGWRITASLQVA